MAQSQTHTSPASLETMVAYLQGTLSEALTTEVEALLASDRNYADAMEYLDRRLSADPDAAKKEIDKFQQIMNRRLDQEVALKNNEGKNRPFWFSRWYSIAAVVLLLILPMAWLLIYQNQTPSVDQLASSHFDIYAYNTNRGIEDQMTLIDSAVMLYAEGRGLYKMAPEQYGDSLPSAMVLAMEQFESLLSVPRDSISDQVFFKANIGLGMGHYLQKDYQTSLSYLEPILEHGQNEFVLDAMWYKAWSLLRLNRNTEALEIFSTLANRPNEYRESAGMIQKAIGK